VPQVPAFDAATIKRNPVAGPVGEGGHRENIAHSPVSLTMRNVSLETCIEWAWGVQNYQISGPEGILPEKYDIFAKTGAPVSPDRMKLTRQTLLAERMKLATLVFVGRPVIARTGIKEFSISRFTSAQQTKKCGT